MDKDVLFLENKIDPRDFIRLKQSIGWVAPSSEMLEKAFEHNLFSVVAFSGGNPVGMGRLVGDGVVIWYIQDVVVEPKYQGTGIGKAIVERMLEHIRKSVAPGSSTMVGLMAARGRESFYEELGFHIRPDEGHGHGMYMQLNID